MRESIKKKIKQKKLLKQQNLKIDRDKIGAEQKKKTKYGGENHESN